MSILPADSSKWQWPAGPVVRTPDCPLERDIRELARREEVDARASWQKKREAAFADLIADELHVLDDAVALLADRSKSAATARKYKAHWDKFTKWVAEFIVDADGPLSPLPANAELCAFYLLTQLTSGASYSVIKQMSAALSDAHVTNFLPDPTQTLVCRAAIRLARQRAGEFPKAELNDKGSEQAGSNGKLNGKDSEHKEASDEKP